MQDQNKKVDSENPSEARDESKKGHVFQGDGQTNQTGKQKGHDLLNSDSSTSGVGAAVNSPGEANEMDSARNQSDRH